MILVDGISTHETPLRFKQWSHMISTESVDELHAMADQLGLRRSWFQNGSFAHYDIVPTKRAIALKLGAREAPARAILFLNYDYANRRKVRPCAECAKSNGVVGAAGPWWQTGCVRCDRSIYEAMIK